MSRHSLSLKTRVRYEDRARNIDRRATIGADLEKLPDPIWHMVSISLRNKFGKFTTAKPVTSAAPKK